MKKYLKENWKFLLLVLIGGCIGGYCLGYYNYDSLSNEILKEMQEQNITREIIAISTMIQYGILYGVLLAGIGIILAKNTNLWKKFEYQKKGVINTLIITIIATLILYPGDKILFGSFSTFVKESYQTPPTIYKILGGLLVGGIIEEVMLRLFFMSFLVWIIKKIFYQKEKDISLKIYVIANILSALTFAALHLPSTAAMTTLTPILIFRCFLLNGGIGLAFGYLYRKYGIGYAMIAHGFCHLLSDILMLIFI